MELHALLERLGPVRRHGTSALVSCPNHDDVHPSLEVAAGEKGIILICRAGCPQREVIQAVCAKAGIRPADLFWEARCPVERRLVATYDYHDAEGRLLFQTVRYAPKAFRQRRPNGAGGWLWNLHGIEPVLYRLPAVQAAIAAGQTIYLVEGEKDTDALHQIGLTATCNPMGAKKWRGSYSHALRDALVVIVPDNDPPGQAHAALVAAALRGIAKAVRILLLPNLPPKGDVSDWLAAGGSRGELEALAAATSAQNGASAVSATTPTPSATASPIPLPYSDYTNAVALVQAYGQDFRYCYPWKRWLVWTGTHWAEDTSGAVMRVAKDTITHRVRREDVDDEQKLKALMAHVKTSLSTSKLKAMVESAQSESGIAVQPADLDKNPWLLNCVNGTLDLRAGLLHPHQRTDYMTRCLEVAYDPMATCPTWDTFLWRVMGGSITPDSPEDSGATLEAKTEADTRAQELIAYLQKAAGYALSGDTSEQCLFLLYGTGANGKSTFLETLLALLGDYGMQADFSTFLHRDRDSVRNDLAALRGARFVSAVEASEGRRFAESLLKQLTGRDTIRARFLYAEEFQFIPQFTLFLAANSKPAIHGTDHAIWRRVKLIPFTVTIPAAEQDKTLPYKLRDELPGILAWAVRGCLAWQRDGLGAPESVTQATQGYRDEMDVIGRFIKECCFVSPQAQVKATVLYKAYTDWCTTNGERYDSQKTFAQYLENKGFMKKESHGIWRLGLELHAGD